MFVASATSGLQRKENGGFRLSDERPKKKADANVIATDRNVLKLAGGVDGGMYVSWSAGVYILPPTTQNRFRKRDCLVNKEQHLLRSLWTQ